jgi:serine/threonine-protein kinase
VEAAEPFLRRADEQAHDAWSERIARLARLRLHALLGRFDPIQPGPEGAKAGLDELSSLTYLEALARLEARERAAFVSVAERFLAERHAAAGGFVQLPTEDPSPLLWRELARAGRLTDTELGEKLERWRSQTRARGFGEGIVWFESQVIPARTPQQAQKAVAERPEHFVVAQVGDNQLAWDALGRLYRLSGDFSTARRLLTTATKSCTLLLYPMAHLHAYAELGETCEALDDEAAACAAYQKVLRYWGRARPRSETADRARARSRALGCKEP